MREENWRRRATGAAQAMMGRAMRAFGNVFGSRRAKLEGRAEEIRGRTNVKGAKLAGRIEGGIRQAGGAIKRRTGEALGGDRGSRGGGSRSASSEERKSD